MHGKRINIRYGAKVLLKLLKNILETPQFFREGSLFFRSNTKGVKADFSFANVLEFKNNRLTGKYWAP